MPNLLVTGPPRSGKTTIVERVKKRLTELGLSVGGVYCPEIREGGERVGFRIVDVATGDWRVLSSVDRESGPQVGKYRVNVAGLTRVSERALSDLAAFDAVVIDEVAPMELESEAFVEGLERALAARTPVVAAVHRSTEGYVGDLEARTDTETFLVDPDSRDALPGRIARQVLDARG